MQSIARVFTAFSDNELLREIETLTLHERETTAEIIAALAEIDSRQLYLPRGFSSLFTYCTEHLHFSEHEAYDRMKVARAVRQWPRMLELLADGSLTVTAARLLAPHLTAANHETVLVSARHKRIREVEEQIAALRPLPDVPSTVRRLPPQRRDETNERNACAVTEVARCTGRAVAGAGSDPNLPQQLMAPAVVPKERAVIAPLAPERYRIQFTIGRETRERLRRVQDLLRHVVPDGDLAVVFDRALTVLLASLENTRLAHVVRAQNAGAGNPSSRHVPAAVRREVWARDGGRCAFVGAEGRCTETGFLEFHHLVPYAEGGQTVVSNLQLRCRPHNAYEAALHFGPSSDRDPDLRAVFNARG